MSEVGTTPGVALLFADAELGAHLREALTALGARIVHEGPAAQVSPEALAASGADVVVVNLEPGEEAHLEQLYDALDSGSYQVIFNDAEASRNLSGWDRARWARHLAAKLVGSTDVDPPRPAGALPAAESAVDAASGPAVAADGESGVPDVVAAAAEAGEPPGAAQPHAPALDATSDALPARDEIADATAGDGADTVLQEGTPVLDAMSDALPAGDETVDVTGESATADDADTALAAGTPDTAGEVPHDDAGAAAPGVAIEERQTIGDSSAVADWELIDFDAAPPSAAAPREDAREFGVEKMRAEDFLAPDTSVNDSPVEPGIDLELVSLEDSIAPTMFDEPVSEMLLGEGMGSIRHVVMVGAGAEAAAELGAFLAALPADLPDLVLLVQHQQDRPLDEMVAALDANTQWPVGVADDGTTGKYGEAWLVPAGRTCRLRRDGVIRLAAVTTTVLGNPSIDECLTALAGAFGADVTAIVLAGAGYDALAGAQEVHDHGGRVWVQDPAACGEDAMATAIHNEGLATFTGAPEELARHLGEEYA